MKIISFDVGMKNLAFCLFDINNNNEYSILKWDVINICDESNKYFCNIPLNNIKLKNKKIINTISNTNSNDNLDLCNSQAKYKKNENFYCKKHALLSTFKVPPPNSDFKKLNKKKVADLQEFITTNNIFIDNTKKYSKFQLIECIQKEFNEKYVQPITTIRADEISLVLLGKNMMIELNKIFDSLFGKDKIELDVVIIENQISTIASRMKTLQGMISQYFIMKGIPSIEFISSINKLKIINNSNKTSYAERKSKGIEICKKIIDDNIQFQKYKNYIDKHKKKDDLADCFLQGIYFLKLKNLINIANVSLDSFSSNI